jgi:hypothetical protein
MPNFAVSTSNGNKSKKEDKITLSYSLKDADRPFSDEEIEIAHKAEIYNVDKEGYDYIEPVLGTLIFLFRNLKGGNQSVIAALRTSLNQKYAAMHKIKDVVTKYDSLDKYSQKRADVWDLICKDLNISPARIWDYFVVGMKEFVKASATMGVELNKNDIIEATAKFAQNEKNSKDRELLFKAGNLISNEPLVEINQQTNNTLNQQNNIFGESFAETIKNSNNQLRDKDDLKILEETKQRELTKGNQDYIDAEVLESDKDYVEAP